MLPAGAVRLLERYRHFLRPTMSFKSVAKSQVERSTADVEDE